ncbi:MAG: DUF4105 domain-containing protein [Myxococcales bacterium]
MSREIAAGRRLNLIAWLCAFAPGLAAVAAVPPPALPRTPAAPAVAALTSTASTPAAAVGSAPLPAGAPAASTPVAAPPIADADPLTVEVLTFGPGQHPFTRFGHNAIRVIDRQAGTDVVYNFGTFIFDSPRLLVDFLKGRLRYWLSRASMAATMRMYQREDRDIETQELELTPGQKRELVTRLEVNARPENRDYRYDYFADNCSTRVRDAIDGVMQGRLRASAVGQGTMTLRAHALRMAADDLPLYTALLIVLGPRSDRPVDEWAEDFLPEMLQRTLRNAESLPAGDTWLTGPGGDRAAAARTGHLVKSERVLFADDRPAPRREPPNRLPAFLGVGVAAGVLLFLLGRLGRRWVLARLVFGLLVSALGLFLGGIGCFLVGSWAFTPHAVVYRNENIMLFAPFAITLAILGLGTAFGSKGATRKAFLVAAAALGFAFAGCALKMFPWSRQDNSALLLMMLPFWWGLTAGTRAVGLHGEPRD